MPYLSAVSPEHPFYLPLKPGTYHIQHSSIAAGMYLRVDDFIDYLFIVGDDKKVGLCGTPYDYDTEPGIERFNLLPEDMRTHIRKRFDEVFALPIEKRGEWVMLHQEPVTFRITNPSASHTS